MKGYGSSGSDAEGFFDWGYGDPTPAGFDPATDPLDLGYGSVPTAAFVPTVAKGAIVPDDGGAIFALAGEWPSLGVPPGMRAGPFRVQFVARDGTVYPDPTKRFGCYSARVNIRQGGRGTACETNLARTRLEFASPVAPPGVYDVRVSWGPHWAEGVTASGAVTVVYRHRSLSEYTIRSSLPELYKGAAPRAAGSERLLTTTREADVRAAFPMGLLATLTRAFGQEVQVMGGPPVTLLTADLAWDGTVAQVESTLGLPGAGAVFIGSRRYTYTSKTSTRLVGLVPEANDGTDIPAQTEVVCDLGVILPD